MRPLNIDYRLKMGNNKTSFKAGPSDEEFRRLMRDLIDAATDEILVVTGEAGAFKNYEDMKWAIRRATQRGVKVKVYARTPAQSTVNKMITYGCEVYLGETVPKDHYTVIDRKVYIESLEHEPHKTGVRKGSAYHDAGKAVEKAAEFSKYVSKAKKAKIDLARDPLLKVLKEPMELSFETDSANI
jgi:sugar-specific transcriptional regulator TrmB